MLRKLMMVAAAAAIPLGAVALGAGPAAATKGPPPASPPLTCSASGTVNFAPPGISRNGSISLNKTSTTTTSGLVFSGSGCGSGGTGPANTIVSKSTVKCSKKVANENKSGGPQPGCMVGGYNVYDQASAFASTGTATLQKALKKLSFTVNGIPFSGKTTSAAVSGSGQCSGEAGFVLSGTVKAKPYTYSTFTLIACLGHDTGTGTTGSFVTDIAVQLGSPSSTSTIATASIDGGTGESSLSIS